MRVMRDGDAVQKAVREEQLRLVYRSGSTVLAINIVTSIVVAGVIGGQFPDRLMLMWLAAIGVMLLARGLLFWRYHRRPLGQLDTHRWALLFCVGAAASGAIWGALGWLCTLYLTLPYQVFVAFVLGGMGLGSLSVSGAYLPAYLAYLLPALLPIILAWFYQAERVSVGMAVLGAAFIVAMYILGRHLNQSFTKSIRLSLDRAALVDTLRHANAELQQSTDRLAKEAKVRKRTETELRESEATYRAMFEKNEAVKLLIDPDTGRIVDANPAASTFYGYSPEQLKDKKVADINTLPKEEIDKHMSSTRDHQQGRFEFRHRLASGDIRDVEVHSAPIEVRGRQLLFSIVHDITSRKRAEGSLRKARVELENRVRERTEALTRANEQLRQEILDRKRAEALLVEEKERAEVTLHSIGDAVITTSADGSVEYMNPVAEAMTGWTLQRARGESIEAVFRVVGDQSREQVLSLVAQSLAGKRVLASPNHSLLLSHSGKEYAIQYSAAPILTHDGTLVGAVLVFADVTEAQRMARQIAHQAAHDSLTGLVNRREFERRLRHAVLSAQQHGVQHQLCYVDLDRFKLVNDTAGHIAGDELLKQVAHLLSSKIRDRDTLARLGGDEFAVLLENCPVRKAAIISEALITAVQDFQFTWAGSSFEIGASIGVAPITVDSETTVQVLSEADLACYMAKEEGRNRVHFYREDSGDLTRGARPEVLQAAELKSALHDGRFHLHCQPIVALAADRDQPLYYEILLRLRDHKQTVQPPSAFIPTAERYGLMANIDRWVIHTSCTYYAESFGDGAGPGISINLSGNSLDDDSLVNYVLQELADGQVPPERVCFEITETAAISNLAHAAHLITTLKDSGCRFALDDFGRGLSSLTYLKRLPVDYIKIDGSFIRDMVDDAVDCAMVEAVNKLSHRMGIETIAEYVESASVVAALRDLGVDYGQGFAIGTPTPLENISYRLA
jgi:diguanylate cyclase (GGDEF)-like protein/PAS domain S-box-containing protein